MEPDLLAQHRGEYALMHDGAIVDFCSSSAAAYREGMERFGDGNFSCQEVGAAVVDLGWFNWFRERA